SLQTRISTRLKEEGLPDVQLPKTLDQRIQQLSQGSVFETQDQRRERLAELGQLRSAQDVVSMSPAGRLLHTATGQTGPTVLGELADFGANVLHFADTGGGIVRGNEYVQNGLDELKAFGAYMRGRGDVPAETSAQAAVKSGAGMLGAAEKYAILTP